MDKHVVICGHVSKVLTLLSSEHSLFELEFATVTAPSISLIGVNVHCVIVSTVVVFCIASVSVS